VLVIEEQGFVFAIETFHPYAHLSTVALLCPTIKLIIAIFG